MLFQIRAYIRFLLKSTNQHGVHSPFVYKLLTDCFYDSKDKVWYPIFNKYRRQLLENNAIISVEDFGAGSKKIKSNKRKISNVAKNAGISKNRAYLLGRLVTYFDCNTVLEIGTSLGIATASIHLANPNASIITLEGCENTATIARNSFELFKFENIKIKTGDFNTTLPEVIRHEKFDFIYFDGNHQKQPTIDYFELCLKHIHNDSIFIFDDIYWSKGMQKAWSHIKNHAEVTISIDTFYWGIVCFRKEQPKQHFTIRV